MITNTPDSTVKLLFGIIGEAAALRMMEVKNFGGRTIELPKKETGRGEQAFACIAEVIGHDNAKRLSSQFGGERLYIPNLHHHFIAKRNKKIVTSYNNGTSVAELVKEYEISDRWIREILKTTDMDNELQVSLF